MEKGLRIHGTRKRSEMITGLALIALSLPMLRDNGEQIALVWTNSSSKAVVNVYGGFGATDMGLASKVLGSIGYKVQDGLTNSQFTKAEADRTLTKFLRAQAKHRVLWVSAIGSLTNEGGPTILCADSLRESAEKDVLLSEVLKKCGASISQGGPMTIICDVGWGVSINSRNNENRFYTKTSKFLPRYGKESVRVAALFREFREKGGVVLSASGDGGVAYERKFGPGVTSSFASAFTQETHDHICRLALFGGDITEEVLREELDLQFKSLWKQGTLIGQQSIESFKDGFDEERRAFLVKDGFQRDSELSSTLLDNLKKIRFVVSGEDRDKVIHEWKKLTASGEHVGPFVECVDIRPFSQIIRSWQVEKPTQMSYAELETSNEDNFLNGSTLVARGYEELVRAVAVRLRYSAAVRRLYYQPEIQQLSHGEGGLQARDWAVDFPSREKGNFVDGDSFAVKLSGSLGSHAYAFLFDRSNDTGTPRLLAPTCDVVDTGVDLVSERGPVILPKNADALQIMDTGNRFGRCRVLVVHHRDANYATFKRVDDSGKLLPGAIRDSMFLEHVVNLIEKGATWSWSSKSYTMKTR